MQIVFWIWTFDSNFVWRKLAEVFYVDKFVQQAKFFFKVFFTLENMSHGNLPCPSCLTLNCFARDKCDCHDSSHKFGTLLCALVVSGFVSFRKLKINLTPHLHSSISLPSVRYIKSRYINIVPGFVSVKQPDNLDIVAQNSKSSKNFVLIKEIRSFE